MQLIHFSYKEADWTLKPLLPLREVSLLLNKSTVGKPKAMDAVNSTISYILQTATTGYKDKFSSSLVFEHEGKHLSYSFSVSAGEITTEELGFTNQAPFLKRDRNSALLHGEIINPPANKLALQLHSDTKQDLYIEKIISWAKHAYSLSCAKAGIEFNSTSIASAYHRTALFIMMKSLSKASLNNVTSQMHQLNYCINSIEAIEHNELQALYLLIYMEFISLRTKPSLLLIDNLSEGLDYDRSIQLGRLLFSFCLKNNIQLIISSNNTFLIHVLDLKYWNVLLRKELK